MARVIIICGPTASGKTKLSIEVAKAFNGEVISADSMQIYKHLDVGTAKVLESEKQGIPHHMLNIVDPDQAFSVAEYVEQARKIIYDVIARGRTPILVGGTGLYVNSLIFGYNFSNVSENSRLREELKAFCEREGSLALYERLKKIAPERAEKLHPNDVKRVIRAIEAAESGEIAQTGGGIDPDKAIIDYVALMIEPERSLLYDRINQRVDQMVSLGLIDEAKMAIEDFKLTRDNQSMQAIGYKQLFDYFENKCSLNEAVEQIKKATRNYAKRQLTWFRKFPKIRIYNELNIEKIIKELQN